MEDPLTDSNKPKGEHNAGPKFCCPVHFHIRYDTVDGTDRRIKSKRTWKAQKDGTIPAEGISQGAVRIFPEYRSS